MYSMYKHVQLEKREKQTCNSPFGSGQQKHELNNCPPYEGL